MRISIRFTHQDVAGIINTSRITTNKVMKRMEEEGILLKREGRYILRALPALGAAGAGRGSVAHSPFALPEGAAVWQEGAPVAGDDGEDSHNQQKNG